MTGGMAGSPDGNVSGLRIAHVPDVPFRLSNILSPHATHPHASHLEWWRFL